MTCDIFVRPFERGFIAAILGVPGCIVEAATRDEATEKTCNEMRNWLAAGEIVRVEIECPSEAQKLGLGIFADEDDESWNEFLTAMKEYRQQVDADPSQF